MELLLLVFLFSLLRGLHQLRRAVQCSYLAHWEKNVQKPSVPHFVVFKGSRYGDWTWSVVFIGKPSELSPWFGNAIIFLKLFHVFIKGMILFEIYYLNYSKFTPKPSSLSHYFIYFQDSYFQDFSNNIIGQEFSDFNLTSLVRYLMHI